MISNMKYIIIVALLIIFIITKITCYVRCDSDKPFLRYYRVKNCYKSELPIISWKNAVNLDDCMKFSRERNGLAFNYSPSDARNLIKTNKNCQVLGCPEIGNFSNSNTLKTDAGFDYYSSFGNSNVTENATCIRSIGLFSVIEEKLNYTEAIQYCQSIGADLATVLTEVRTNSLATFVANEIREWYKSAYVGLDDMETEGVFETPLGNYLGCTKYRAWSPGHPRDKLKNEDCVILNSNKTWKVINCKIKLPFICEFYPEAPLTQDHLLKHNVTCKGIREKKKRKKCLNDKKMFELINNSTRLDKCALLNEEY